MSFTGEELIDQLALRIEDPMKKIGDSAKIMSINNSQFNLIGMLHNNYLINELSYLKSNVTVTSGVTATLNRTILDHNVVKGAEGIIDVQVYGGLYATRIAIEDLKRTENKYLEGTVRNPLYYVFQNKIYMLPSSITKIDITFLRFPHPIIYAHTADQADSGASTTKFDGVNAELGSTNDEYNNALIYHNQNKTYHVITDYVGADREFTVSPAAGSNFIDGQTFYFLSHGFDELNLDLFICELAEWLTPLMLDIAESECWLMLDNEERSISILSRAIDKVNKLNATVKQAEGIGVKRE